MRARIIAALALALASGSCAAILGDDYEVTGSGSSSGGDDCSAKSCAECGDCVQSEDCAVETDACANHDVCAALAQCIALCQDGPCIDDCCAEYMDDPEATSRYATFLQCVADACPACNG
jgi:hypothetical protein